MPVWFKLANDGHDTRALSLPWAQEHSAHGQVYRNGARQVQRLLEGLTMAGPARGPGPLCGKLALSACRVELAHLVVAVTGAPHVTHAGEVTSRAITCAVGPSSSCAPAGQLRCQPPSSAGSAFAFVGSSVASSAASGDGLLGAGSAAGSAVPSMTFAASPARAASMVWMSSMACSISSSLIALTPPECSTFTSRGHNNVNSLQ